MKFLSGKLKLRSMMQCGGKKEGCAKAQLSSI